MSQKGDEGVFGWRVFLGFPRLQHLKTILEMKLLILVKFMGVFNIYLTFLLRDLLSQKNVRPLAMSCDKFKEYMNFIGQVKKYF